MPGTINYYGMFRLKWSTYLVLQAICVTACLLGAWGTHHWLRDSSWFLFKHLWLILLAAAAAEIVELLVIARKRQDQASENEIN